MYMDAMKVYIYVSIIYNTCSTDKLFIVILNLKDYMGTTYWQFKIVNAYKKDKQNKFLL